MGQAQRESSRRVLTRDEGLRRLTRSEIETKLQECALSIAGGSVTTLGPLGEWVDEEERPRTLSCRQLIRSMRKYIVYN